jgi:GxxExxY protein
MVDDILSEAIIACAFRVHNCLGGGFLETVYRNALAIELGKSGFSYEIQYPIQVSYAGHIVGSFYADIVVERQIILELKAVESLAKIHEVQLVNYLKATGYDLGLLINFGPQKVTVKRKTRLYLPHNDEKGVTG